MSLPLPDYVRASGTRERKEINSHLTICKAPNGLQYRVNIPKDRELYPLPCLLNFVFLLLSVSSIYFLIPFWWRADCTQNTFREFSHSILFQYSCARRFAVAHVQVHWVRWCAHRIDCNVQLRLICNCLMFLAAPVGRWASVLHFYEFK